MDFVLALDQGTTSSRALLFDRGGVACGMVQRELRQFFPQPGWVEHDAWEILDAQVGCVRELLATQRLAPERIAAVGIANQRETCLLWERATGRPLAPAIVWQDRRTAGRCDELRAAGHGGRVRALTGLEIDAYFSATKLEWLLDHLPDARRRAEAGELAAGTIDSWLAWNLAGRHVTDVSNASRTMLFDIARCAWDDELLELFRIPRALLPEVVPSSGAIGTIDSRWFGTALPLTGIAGDQQAATFGQACFSPGLAKNTYGTGCFMLMNTGTQPLASRSRLLTTVGWRCDGVTDYMLEGSVFMGGAVVQWLRDGLGLIAAAAEVEALAASVPDSGGVVLVPAFTGLGAPYWDAHARAALFGMSRGTGAAHIARASLDAIACQCDDLLAAMRDDGAPPIAELHVDGGAARNDLLMQIQADLLGIPVVRPQLTETTAFGAAALAGLAVGFWRDRDELAALWRVDRRFEPLIAADERQERRALWQRAVGRTLGWGTAD